jgi:CheY-like chemotaxis protein
MKKILLVEDNEECRKMLTCIIHHLGYDVIQVDTLDAICRATAERPGLILISLDFPRMWGLDLIISLKNNPQTADIPILVYPPWDSEEITEVALKSGATEVLKEPFLGIFPPSLAEVCFGRHRNYIGDLCLTLGDVASCRVLADLTERNG